MNRQKALLVMVVSPDTGLSRILENQLPESRFEVIHCRPGSDVSRQASRAQIAVVDRINERPESACKEIRTIKKCDARLPIIAVSERSSGRDAEIVNQGVFFYLAGFSKKKLVRVVQAAADSLDSRTNRDKQEKIILRR
ncbi:MAG: hypothetical protein R3224_01460 [Balneolaceae bacterium]|nr:hypothetical protein [Balneolaceae bacterium]